MLSLVELIKGCESNDALAWEDLCKIVEGGALFRIRSLLRRRHLDGTLDGDILQELYGRIRSRPHEILGRFHGTTVEELRAFMGVVAYRFTLKHVAKLERLQHREQQILRWLVSPTRQGPTEQEIELTRRDLESIMPAADKNKLRRIGQDFRTHPADDHDGSSPSSAIPGRTLRRWRLELFRKYSDRI